MKLYQDNGALDKMLREKLLADIMEDRQNKKSKFPAIVINESYISYGTKLLIGQRGGGSHNPNNVVGMFVFGCPNHGIFSHKHIVSLN